MSDDHLNHDEFGALLSPFGELIDGLDDIAVAVSGGPDSMALVYLLSDWAKEIGINVHALTVDHGLRSGSDREAEGVGRALHDLPHVFHEILKWDLPSGKRIQEEARKARYGLMAEYCKEQGIRVLFLAHHMDDQAETFLFRLAKGSGLDGLGGMRPVHEYDDGLFLCRPFLDVSKGRLIATCQVAGVEYILDPSNENDAFARVRLRQSRGVLEEEGLSAKRLAVTARRLLRAREALEGVAGSVYAKVTHSRNTNRIEIILSNLMQWPEEIVLRVVLLAMAELGRSKDYGPRMEKVEDLVSHLMDDNAFRKRTLGGVIFYCDEVKDLLVMEVES